MRRKILSIFLFLTVFSAVVSALELGMDFSMSNFNFDPDRSPLDTDFDPYYLPVGYSFYGNHKLDDASGVSFGFLQDRILKRMLYGLFSYSGDFYTLSVGPFFGLLNTEEKPVNPGVTASVKLQMPGKIFFLLESSRTLNILNIFMGNKITGVMSNTGDYLQEDNKISIGVYVRNTIVSLSIRSRLYSLQDETLGAVTDSLTDYTLTTDIYQKNSPFKPMISFTYRNLSKIYEDLAPSVRHTAGSLILGTRVDFTFRKGLSLYANLDSCFYTFGLDDLIGEFGTTDYYFTAAAGFKINLDA